MASDEEYVRLQMDQRRPVYINDEGDVILKEAVEETDRGPVDRRNGAAVTKLKRQRWWAWYDTNPQRLLTEVAAMAERFPGFQFQIEPGGLTWTGWLRPQNGRRYLVEVVCPDDFPYHCPEVRVVEPEVHSPKHQIGDKLCLFHPSDGTWSTNTTATQVVALAAAWLFAYEYHERHCRQGPGGRPCSSVPCSAWPGDEA